MQLTRLLVVLLMLPTVGAAGDEYVESVLPYVTKYCFECHNAEVHKADLDLTVFNRDRDVTAQFRRWNNVIEFIRQGEMPPEDASQPSIDESNSVVLAINNILLAEAIKHAGDPGIVLPRRLSNTEYDTAIRDLTGVDIRPTKTFPADPAGGEGFDNTGEALGTSPSLVKKYLSAAQHVADHLVLKPSGISFAPFPVNSYNERKKLTELAIIEFYESHNVQIDDYLEAAWRYRYRSDSQRDLSIEQWAIASGIALPVGDSDSQAQRGPFPVTAAFGLTENERETSSMSNKYLALVFKTLSEAPTQSGVMKAIGNAWNAIPAPVSDTDRPSELRTLRNLVALGRRVLTSPEQQLIKASAGNWPISHLDFRAKVASMRDKLDRNALKNETMLNQVRVSAPRSDKDETNLSIFLRVDPAFADGNSLVVVKRPVFSKANRLPNNEKEEHDHQVQSLRSVINQSNPDLVERLRFGKHPKNNEIDEDSFVIQAPALIEITLTPAMRRELDGKHLLLSCQLDPTHSRNGSVFVQASTRGIADSKYSGNPSHLIFRDSETADQFAETAGVFCNTFPNRFFYVDRVRGLAAGFHLVEGFFRDDQPLVKKVLNDTECDQIDRLWQDLDFVTQSAETLLRGFVWFERSEREVLHDERFRFLRSEDPQLVEANLLNKFEKLYLDKMGIKRVGDTLTSESPSERYDMIHGFFNQIREGLRRQRELTIVAEQQALEDIKEFATRAFRRPLRGGEYASFLKLYRTLRNDGQAVEASVRGVLIAVLMSPHFSYHQTTLPGSDGIHPLGDEDLASRLSFFLWSSIPDRELLEVSQAGELQNEDVLIAQTRRMRQDEKIEAFAREFFGQWLRYRDYLQKDPINAEAFPEYTDELRAAIYAEPSRLMTHLIRTDRPITDLLSSDMTFVNGVLAKHYGGTIESQYRAANANRNEESWHPVNGLHDTGRGGLFGMAAILTKNSAGERTSPVKRGFWSVHHLLGQHFPPPPADVPELPASEKSAKATIRELLATHVAAAQCAMCHQHFDSLGLAMEGFDAIGRTRTRDSAGRSIDNAVRFPNGETAAGIPGLIEYIEQHRRDDFVKTLCRKFLGYALGRSVQLSDGPLLTKMETSLKQNEYRFSVLFEEVVRSSQFRNQQHRTH